MWSTLVAAIAALAGVFLGALLEPLKLRFARRERIRSERLEQSARLVEAGKQAISIVNGSLRLYRLPAEKRAAFDSELWMEASRELQHERNEMRRAAALLVLYGPDDLSSGARNVETADKELMRLWTDIGQAALGKRAINEHEFQRRLDETDPLRDRLEATLDAFTTVAQRYAR